MERYEPGELYPIRTGDLRGRWAHDGEGAVSILAPHGEPAIVAAGLELALAQVFGDSPSITVESEDDRRATFALYPITPSDALIEAIPAAFARLPADSGAWEMTVIEGAWRGTPAE